MIRPGTPADAQAILRIYNPYVTATSISFETVPVLEEVMAARIRETLEHYPWYVREEGGVVLGYAYGSRWKPRDAYRFAVETTVYVAPGEARKGIGASLYQVLLPDLRERGFHNAWASIALPNEASVALHERFGFRKVGHLPEVGWKFGRWVDVGYWALAL
ncbi:MAG: arsinothricin resistance N-acetyltransferase ArsN1 family B [Holophaga sp.]|jgi:phosphinothricin acetyltransferase